MQRLNRWLALKITEGVGTMYAAYVFAVIGTAGVVFALTGNTQGVLIVGAISGYFLQLVLLPIILVGQQLMHTHIKQIHKHLGVKDER